MSQRHPWRRFFARQLDLGLVAVLLGLAIGFFPSSPLDRLTDNNIVFGLLVSLAVVPFEALVLTIFGSTLGKAVYGIRLAREDCRPLGFGESFSRAFRVYLRGLGLGIPIISLLTFYQAYLRLTNEGQTSWDADGAFTVAHIRYGYGRIFVIAVVWLIYLSFIALGLSLAASQR